MYNCVTCYHACLDWMVFGMVSLHLTSLALGTHVQQGLQYILGLSVCLSNIPSRAITCQNLLTASV